MDVTEQDVIKSAWDYRVALDKRKRTKEFANMQGLDKAQREYWDYEDLKAARTVEDAKSTLVALAGSLGN